MSTIITPGFYGKLPCVGDFVRRRLPDAFVDHWDAAMQRLLIASADRDSAEDAPDNQDGDASLHWSFALAPGVCGASAWAGSVIGSRDRVGRAFPLVVAWPIVDDSVAWFDSAQDLLRRAVDGDFDDVDAFDRACAGLARDNVIDALFAAWRAAHSDSDDRSCLWWSPMTDASPGAWVLTDGLSLPAYRGGPGIARSEPSREPHWRETLSQGAASV